ncbi:hypothetical protein QCA50_006152 [Cerrena zonata]|uniref:U6 snRNA phosphodiesterase n=1 Tax=Cerrena zonata TaxID=2478898 RepID=A0AAW0GH17_9APHY
MKRSIPLVQYASSSDADSSPEPEHNAKHEQVTVLQPPPKRRKTLPVLSSTIVGPVHIDNPALHDGRIRTAPHIDGQFAAYVYFPVKLDGDLLMFLQNVLRKAKSILPSIHSIPKNIDSVESTDPVAELHISLSRPVYLRSHQRDELKNAVRRIAKSHAPFQASFATFSELQNDEKTRTFLTIEIGAGHNELKLMSDSLIPTLKAIRQREFYSDPRFHASIGWALMSQNSDSSSLGMSKTSTLPGNPEDEVDNSLSTEFPTVSSLPEELISTLRKEFGTSLLNKSTIGSFSVDSLCVRIGKDVSRWSLSSN